MAGAVPLASARLDPEVARKIGVSELSQSIDEVRDFALRNQVCSKCRASHRQMLSGS